MYFLFSSSTSSDVYSVWSEFTRSRHQADAPHCPAPPAQKLQKCAHTLTWSSSTDPKPGTQAFSASVLAPNLLSGGSSHIPCSSVTKRGDLLNPCPGSVQIPLPAPYSLTVIQFMPEAPLWGIPNNSGHKQNNSFQEFYPVWPRFYCQVSWCVLLLQPKSG